MKKDIFMDFYKTEENVKNLNRIVEGLYDEIKKIENNTEDMLEDSKGVSADALEMPI